jgi:hypothetical protein
MTGMLAVGSRRVSGRRIALVILAVAFALLGPARSGLAQDDGTGDLVRGDDGCWYDPASGDVAYCEGDVDDELVLGDDGCWYHPDGALAYCEPVEEPPTDGGLIPGDDGCLYYPDGGLAECPDGGEPTDGGCIPPADGSDGCVIPGPVAGEAEGPATGQPASGGSTDGVAAPSVASAPAVGALPQTGVGAAIVDTHQSSWIGMARVLAIELVFGALALLAMLNLVASCIPRTSRLRRR